jgi:hypothetical protein
MANLDPGVDRIDAAIDLLWSAFSGPTFTAWLELWVAARTDPGLAAAVVAVDRGFVETSQELFGELFPPAEYPEAAELGLPLAFAVMDGVALQHLLPYRNDGPATIAAFKTVARRLLRDPDS